MNEVSLSFSAICIFDFPAESSSYPWSFNLCSEAVVDVVNKTGIFIQCSCLIGPLRGYMNRHCEEHGCSFQTLEGRLPIGYYTTLFRCGNFHILIMINHGLCAMFGGCGYDNELNQTQPV